MAVKRLAQKAAKDCSPLLSLMRETLLSHQKESGLSGEEFAARIGLASSSYYDIVNGRAKVTIERVDEIAKKLGVSSWEVLGIPSKFIADIEQELSHRSQDQCRASAPNALATSAQA